MTSRSAASAENPRYTSRHVSWAEINNENDKEELCQGKRSSSSTMMKKEDLIALQKRQQQIEEELAWIKRRVMESNDSVKEGTTASTCDCAIPPLSEQKGRCRPVPCGSVIACDKEPSDSTPLLNKQGDEEQSPPPDHILLFDSVGENHEWEECFSHVRSEEDLDNEKVHNESEFYLKSSMFARGKE